MNIARVFLVALSIAGLYIGGVLSYTKLANTIIPCGASLGCDIVAAHPSSSLYGVPIALFGVAFYACLFVCGAGPLLTGRRSSLFFVGYALSAVGTAVSFYLVWFSASVIGAICPWCLASAVVVGLSLITYALMSAQYSEGAATSHQSTSLRMSAAITFALFAGGASAFGITVSRINEATSAPMANTYAVEAASIRDLAPDNSPAIGRKDAGTSIVMFGDLECPACHAAMEYLLGQVKKGADLRLIFRHFPSSGHPFAYTAAAQGQALGTDEQFFAFAEDVMDTQLQSDSDVHRLALKHGAIDAQRLERAKAIVNRDKQFGGLIGVRGTPTLIILGKDGSRKVPGLRRQREVLAGLLK